MPDDYDVIIIGTGAGGGTLAHTLAPSGKRILLLERGDFLPREMDNWNPDAVFVDGKYISPDTWYDSRGHAVPAPGPLLRRRARPSSTARPSTGCGREDFGEIPTWTGSRRRGRSATTTSSPGTPRPSSSTRCTVTGARTRPRATGRSRTRGRRSATSPACRRSPTP